MKSHRKKKSQLVRTSLIIINLGFILTLLPFLINHHIIYSTHDQISSITTEDTPVLARSFDSHDDYHAKHDAIVVLGASIYSDGTPSPMLKDRLDTAIETYFSFIAATNTPLPIIVSGDGGSEFESYDEVSGMANYLALSGVNPAHIIEDPQGFSTYESIYNVHASFGVQAPIIITQKYHLYRALYVANQLQMMPAGIATKSITYDNQKERDLREFMARIKDFFQAIVQPVPTGIRPE